MPILSYFGVVGAALVALLFLADAQLPKSGSIAIGTQEPVQIPGTQRARAPLGSTLVATPAPAPDMKAEAVRLAAPPAGASAAMAQATATQPAAQAQAQAQVQADVAKTDNAKTRVATAPVRKKTRVARRPTQPQSDNQRFAWRGNDGSPFGGSNGGLFGRF